MKKSDFITEVASELGVTKVDATKSINAVFSVIKRTLKKGDSVRLMGFGSFKTSDISAKTVRNPRTGENMNVPACKRARFIPGKALKEAVNS